MSTMTVYPLSGQSRSDLARELLDLAELGGYKPGVVRYDASGGFAVPELVAEAWIVGHSQPDPAPPPPESDAAPQAEDEASDEDEAGDEAADEGGEAAGAETGGEPPAASAPDQPGPQPDQPAANTAPEPVADAKPAPPAVTEQAATAETTAGIRQPAGRRRPRKSTAAQARR